MRVKRSSKNKRDLDQMLDDYDEESNQSTTTTTQPHTLSIISSGDSPNINLSTSNVNQLNATNSDIDISTQTTSVKQDLIGWTPVSKVWSCVKKLDNGKQAACLLCDFICSCNCHSTSTIRQHLISKHNKTDSILQPSTSTKIVLPEALKKQLHQLCYYAIIKDSRPFIDLI